MDPWVLSAAIWPCPAAYPLPGERAQGGRPRPDARKSSEGRRVWLVKARKGGRGGEDRAVSQYVNSRGRPAQTPSGSSRQPRCAFTRLRTLTRQSILCTCLYDPATTPPLLYSFAPLPSPAPSRRPHLFMHAYRLSSPHRSPPASAPGVGLLRGARGPARPADWRGGALGQPPALRSRAPSRMGVAWLKPSLQRLTSCLCQPPRSSSQLFYLF